MFKCSVWILRNPLEMWRFFFRNFFFQFSFQESRAYVNLECEGYSSCKVEEIPFLDCYRVFSHIFKSVFDLIALFLNHLRFQAYDQIELTAETLKITVLCVAICMWAQAWIPTNILSCFWLIRVIFPDRLVQLIDLSTRETVDFWRCWGQTFNWYPEP